MRTYAKYTKNISDILIDSEIWWHRFNNNDKKWRQEIIISE